jgi:phenylalanyl-tRNA synthetase beta chain
VPELAQGIAVSNPISADYEVMRTSLLPGLVEAARRNLARGITDLGLFEVGPVVHPVAGESHNRQSTWAAGVLVGRRAGWMKPGEALDFFDLKRVAVQLLAGLGVPAPLFTSQSAAAGGTLPYHPGVSAEVRRAGQGEGSGVVLGRAGELHPAVLRRLGVEVPVFAFEISVDALEGAAAEVQAVTPPRFPSVTRDISFWADASVPAHDQQAAMRGAGEALLREVAVLEDFRDPKFVPAGKKGMLWTLTYRSDERTLTDAEVDAAHARVVQALGQVISIQIR